MKTYFPFTDYDFYAYLTSGILTLSVLDYALNDATHLSRTDWTWVQIVGAVALAYVTGHITALLSQLTLETFVFRALLTNPLQLQLGLRAPNRIERTIAVLVGRYYEPLPAETRERILRAAADALGRPSGHDLNSEDIFQLGFRRSFEVSGVRPRIESFINQYGFCRNVAFVALFATLLLIWKAVFGEIEYGWAIVAASLGLFVGMFLRFVKFLASCQIEVIRTIII